ncbi:hypothetical protein ACP70R_042007 [Stipagrostis hirtigluma subsp. patula]
MDKAKNPPPVLPVASMDKKKTALLPLPSVQLVAAYALFTAIVFGFCFGMALVVNIPCSQ